MEHVIQVLVYRLAWLMRKVIPIKALFRIYLAVAHNSALVAWMLAFYYYGPEGRDRMRPHTYEFLKKQITPGASVLELGCGQGTITTWLASFAGEVVGIDRQEQAIAFAKNTPCPSNVSFRLADVTEMAIDRKFDYVVCFHILEHIQDVEVFLTKLHQLTAILLVEVPDIEQNIIGLLMRDMEMNYFTDAEHVREYDTTLLRSHLESSGWEMVQCERTRQWIQVRAEAVQASISVRTPTI
jgi:trans-aconitate methyltransferase